MRPSHLVRTIAEQLTRLVMDRLRLMRQKPPGESRKPGQRSNRVSKLGSHPGRYHDSSLAKGRRLAARSWRRWLRSGG